MASVHWKGDDVRYWGKDEAATNFANISEMRRIGEASGVEFVLAAAGDGKMNVKRFDIFEPLLR